MRHEAPITVDISRYPQLRALCWNRVHDEPLDGAEALGLYERNWSFVDHGSLDAAEWDLIHTLTDVYGNGVFLTGGPELRTRL